jgi:xanthine dehydrogenase YagS FAD-binding subunit
MKSFTCERVRAPAEAVAVRNPNSKFIAGGTNLLDLMKLEIGMPTHLIVNPRASPVSCCVQ